MDDDRAADWTNWDGVKVEGAVEVFPGRHVRGKGGLGEEVQGEFGLREELVQEEVGERIRDAGKDGKEVSFKSAGDTFGYIAAMDIWRDKLESAVPLVKDGVTILRASLIVEDLDIKAADLGFEAIHNAVVGSNAMPVVA